MGADKVGFFTDPDNQCTTSAATCLTWRIDSPAGPFDTAVFTDTAQDGQEFDCASLLVRRGTYNASGVITDLRLYREFTVDCSTSELVLTTGAVGPGQGIQVRFEASAAAVDPNGGSTYSNRAKVVTTLEGAETVETPRASVRSTTVGGSASGERIQIVKKDDAGNDANTVAGSVTLPDGSTGLVLTVTNNGTGALQDVSVSDLVVRGGTVDSLSCDFSPLGGPATGTTWVGPFGVDDSFRCTARLTGVRPGEQHEDVATVEAVGMTSGVTVKDHDPYHADRPQPAISIRKEDAKGHAADTPATAVTVPKGSAQLVFTIANTGTEALARLVVSDVVVRGGQVSGLSCDFSDLGGPAFGVTWSGPFEVADSFTCTALLSGVPAGSTHKDVASVSAVGVVTGQPVADDCEYECVATGRA